MTSFKDFFLEYRKEYAATAVTNDIVRYRHSMVAITDFDPRYTYPLGIYDLRSNRVYILMVQIVLHKTNKELELHWISDDDIKKVWLVQYDLQTGKVKTKWLVMNPRRLALESVPMEENGSLMRHKIVLSHNGIVPID